MELSLHTVALDELIEAQAGHKALVVEEGILPDPDINEAEALLQCLDVRKMKKYLKKACDAGEKEGCKEFEKLREL